MRRAALAGVITTAGIIATGAAVRLSESGLGCPDWPQCTRSSLVAAHSRGDPMFHTWIEFGNRMVTIAITLVAVWVFVTAWRFRPGGRRRRDLVWLAAAQPAGIVAQAVVGGIVVLTSLNPALVAVHFLLSSAILAAAVTLYVRAGEGDGPARGLVRTDLRVLTALLVGVTALMLAAGTVVTGTGPLAGTTIDSHGHRTTVPRFHLALENITQLHADIGWFIGALAVAIVIGLLSSVIPYWLEFEALRRVPPRVFGVWMSLQPAVAALIGLAMLGQRLSPAEWAGICCVTVASGGAARGGPALSPQALRCGACLPGSRASRPPSCGRRGTRCAGWRSPR